MEHHIDVKSLADGVTDALLDTCVDEIIAAMGIDGESAKIQRVQTRHRVNLAHFWGVSRGDRILEIGCGQGDTSAVLAYIVGDRGAVVSVDSAPPSYGSPVNLGSATARLKSSSIGKPLEFHLSETLSDPNRFAPGSFDLIVLSHCAWYLSSKAQLHELLALVRPWGRKLCVAEWDARPRRQSQWAHAQAVLLQAQQEALLPRLASNVRCLLTPLDLITVARDAGWAVQNEIVLDSHHLQDGGWEVAMAARPNQAQLDACVGALTPVQQDLFASHRALIASAAALYGTDALDTFAFTAH